ncbi:MAG: hypothetical protein ABIT01_03970 [Thermoanaerobaculia bacterium]
MKTTLTRFAALASLALTLSFLPSASAQAPADKPKLATASASFQEIFEKSLAEKKGITLYVGGQAIAGGVTRIGTDVVELRSQELARIVVRIDRIDGVAAH